MSTPKTRPGKFGQNYLYKLPGLKLVYKPKIRVGSQWEQKL